MPRLVCIQRQSPKLWPILLLENVYCSGTELSDNHFLCLPAFCKKTDGKWFTSLLDSGVVRWFFLYLVSLSLMRRHLLLVTVTVLLLVGWVAQASAELVVGDKFGSWSFSCTALGVDKTRCGLVQTVALAGTGKNIIKVTLGYLGKKSELALIVQTPMNIFLDASVVVSVDQGKQTKMSMQRCQPEGCAAAMQVKPDFLRELSSGSMLKVGFVLWSSKKVPVLVPVSLIGLMDGVAKIKRESVPVLPKDGVEGDLLL